MFGKPRTNVLIDYFKKLRVMNFLRGLLYLSVLNVFGYYTFKIQIVDERLTPIDIVLVVTCFCLASMVGMYRQKNKVELIAARIKN
jgi:hypothetical protein